MTLANCKKWLEAAKKKGHTEEVAMWEDRIRNLYPETVKKKNPFKPKS